MSWWQDSLKETVTYAQKGAGRDQWGKPSFGAQATAPARVQYDWRTTRGVEEEETVITHRIALDAGSVRLRRGDRVWLPEDDPASVGAAKTVRNVARASDLDMPGDELQILEVG